MNVHVAKRSSEENRDVFIDKSFFIASLSRVETLHIYVINSKDLKWSQNGSKSGTKANWRAK